MVDTTHQETEVTEGSGTRAGGFWHNLSGALTGHGERRLFGRRGLNTEQVKAGRVFRRVDAKGRQEIATVIGFCDILGMAHVRYDLRIEQTGHRPFEDGPRVLGIKTFIEHFCEPVSS
ncbi:MAG: hypothetical protein ACFCUT_07935 [Kiloniellaceae bacterium]